MQCDFLVGLFTNAQTKSTKCQAKLKRTRRDSRQSTKHDSDVFHPGSAGEGLDMLHVSYLVEGAWVAEAGAEGVPGDVVSRFRCVS